MGRARRHRVSSLILLVSIVGSMSSTAALALFFFDRAGLLPFQIIPGYEGTKLIFASYEVGSIHYRLGDPPPAQQWRFTADYFDVDPDQPADGMQNLIGAGLQTNGMVEKTQYGTVISDGPVRWTKTYTEGDKIVTKTFEARIYYFTHSFSLYTRYDEQLVLGIGTTEKGCTVRDSRLGLYTSVTNWDPRGNNTAQNFAAILAVEVADIKYYETDSTGARLREGMPQGAVASLGIATGQTLAMYSDLGAGTGGAITGTLGREYIQYLQQENPDISPDPRLRREAYVFIPINEYGAKGASSCQVALWFDAPKNPLAVVTLRIHVLKVDSWISVQTRGSTYQPPLPPQARCVTWIDCWFIDTAQWLSETYGVPLQIAGYIVIGVLVFFFFLFLLLLLVIVAVRAGVRGRDIRELRSGIRQVGLR
ncbi:MAG: hypothetical protein ACP5KY_08260 [Thermoproteus sp.]